MARMYQTNSFRNFVIDVHHELRRSPEFAPYVLALHWPGVRRAAIEFTSLTPMGIIEKANAHARSRIVRHGLAVSRLYGVKGVHDSAFSPGVFVGASQTERKIFLTHHQPAPEATQVTAAPTPGLPAAPIVAPAQPARMSVAVTSRRK